MPRFNVPNPLKLARLVAIVFLLAWRARAGAAAPEPPPPPQQPDAPAPSRPLLEQLDRETRSLYRGLQGGVLRVQMPTPRPALNNGIAAAAADAPFNKYNLNPDVRRQLLEQQARGNTAQAAIAPQSPATQPVVTDAQGLTNQGVLIVVPQNGGTLQQLGADNRDTRNPADPRPAGDKAAAFAPNNLGLLLDDRGHVLVPLYVARDAVGDAPVRLAGADGPADARFVGSDAQTNLTVLQLAHPAGRPVRLATDKPDEGALVMLLSTSGDGAARLGVWNAAAREQGVVVGLDGRVLGVARAGQFLGGAACQLIADQIIRHGAVRRATLGVIVTQIDRADPARRQRPALGDRPAMRVDQVMPGSAADQAGVRPGDVLLAFAGDPVTDVPALAAAVAGRRGPTRLQLLRGDEIVEVSVDLQPK